MTNQLDTADSRATVLAALRRGYQVMMEEKEIMKDMCQLLQEEQKQISELLKIVKVDVEELSTVSSDSHVVMELTEKMKAISDLHEQSQPLIEKAGELCGVASGGRKSKKEEFNQLFRDLLRLKETEKESDDDLAS